jgi:hypothetical protein
VPTQKVPLVHGVTVPAELDPSPQSIVAEYWVPGPAPLSTRVATVPLKLWSLVDADRCSPP